MFIFCMETKLHTAGKTPIILMTSVHLCVYQASPVALQIPVAAEWSIRGQFAADVYNLAFFHAMNTDRLQSRSPAFNVLPHYYLSGTAAAGCVHVLAQHIQQEALAVLTWVKHDTRQAVHWGRDRGRSSRPCRTCCVPQKGGQSPAAETHTHGHTHLS